MNKLTPGEIAEMHEEHQKNVYTIPARGLSLDKSRNSMTFDVNGWGEDEILLRIPLFPGAWAISFADLEMVYRKAKELRDTRSEDIYIGKPCDNLQGAQVRSG